MATANFRPMLYDMPLVCGGLDDLPEWDAYEEFYDAERLADDFTENLKYHELPKNTKTCSIWIAVPNTRLTTPTPAIISICAVPASCATPKRKNAGSPVG